MSHAPAAPRIAAADDPQQIAQAAERLRDGELVAFPTETVYGLGARADVDAAVQKIFAAKGRPADHPLIVHVADAAAARHFAREVPPVAERLVQAFWPGPLTLILPRREGVAMAAAGGQDSIGLRCPAHPTAHALLVRCQALGVLGVAAPSANRFGRVSPTRAAHVAEEFAHDDLLILDAGASDLGIESTIVDLTRGHPVLLRPGTLARSRLQAVAGEPLLAPDARAPRASGTLEAHYAPRARVRVMPADSLRQAVDILHEELARKAVQGGAPAPAGVPKVAVYSRSAAVPPLSLQAGPTATAVVIHRRMPADAAAAARELFAVLRELDAQGVSLIWVEEPPTGELWDGVRDRLRRAAAAG